MRIILHFNSSPQFIYDLFHIHRSHLVHYSIYQIKRIFVIRISCISWKETRITRDALIAFNPTGRCREKHFVFCQRVSSSLSSVTSSLSLRQALTQSLRSPGPAKTPRTLESSDPLVRKFQTSAWIAHAYTYSSASCRRCLTSGHLYCL